MAVPHRLLLGWLPGKKGLVDDVLYAHDLRALRVSIEDHALDEILVEDGAVVVRFHLHVRMAVVENGSHLNRSLMSSMGGLDCWVAAPPSGN